MFVASWNCWRWATKPSLGELQRLADTQEQRERLIALHLWLSELRGARLSFVELNASGSLKRDRLAQVVSHQPTLPRVVQSYYQGLDPARSATHLGVLRKAMASFQPHSSNKRGHGSRSSGDQFKASISSPATNGPSGGQPPHELRVASAPSQTELDGRHYLHGVPEEQLKEAIGKAHNWKILPNKAWPEFALLEAREIVQFQPTIAIGELARRTGERCREKFGQRITVSDDTIAKLLGEASSGDYAQFRLLVLEMKSAQEGSEDPKPSLFADES